METTMKHRAPILRSIALLLAVGIGAGCALPVAPSATGGKGTLTVQTGALGARLVMPTLGTLTYDLSMELRDSDLNVVDSFQEFSDEDGLFPLRNLSLGAWTATVDVRSDGQVVASGTVTRTLTATSSATLVVPVSWFFTGTTIAPVFTVDASASPYPVLAASVYWDGTLSGVALDLSTKTLALDFGAQSQGIHQLRILFYRDLQKTLPVGLFEQGVVYLADHGVPNIVLNASDFHTVGRPEMVEISGGSFVFGISTATVSPFLMGKYPVTQAQFEAIMGFNPSFFNNSDSSTHANPEATWAPVEQVTWFDAAEFTNRLSLAEGLQPVYTLVAVTRSGRSITAATVTTDLSRNGYRLPTEPEYEYATRAGTTSAYFWGGLGIDDYAWTSRTSTLTRTYGVGQKLPNNWGLYDMVGNVWSWLNDVSGAQPDYPTVDYSGPLSGSERMLKGGSFSDTAPNIDDYAQSAYRLSTATPATSSSARGFRVVRRPQLEADNPTAALSGTIPVATLDGGYGRLLHIEADQQYPGKFLVSGVSGALNNTGISPWGTNLMARFNTDASLDSTFGNNTDGPLNSAQLPYGPYAMFGPYGQTNVIQSAYGGNGQSYFSGFAQNSFGLYVFQPSIAGGWTHTEVFRHNAEGILDVNYSQPVYTPGTEYYLPFVVYAQFRALAPTVIDASGRLYTAGYDANTGNFAVIRMDSNGAYPWQNDPDNVNVRFHASSLSISAFQPGRAAMQTDGKLLVVGNNADGYEGQLLRIDTSGSLDIGFANAGSFSYLNGNADGSQRHYSDVRYHNGKIYLTGWDYYPALSNQVWGFVLRLNDDGSFDTSFAPGGDYTRLGSVTEPQYILPAGSTYTRALAVGNQGIVAAGSTTDATPRAFVQRLTLDGAARGAPVRLADQGYGGAALSIALDEQNSVGVAGYTTQPGATEEHQTSPAFWRF